MGKTTAVKNNFNLVDFDDIVRDDIKQLAEQKSISIQELKKRADKEYLDLLLKTIEQWRNNPDNIGKILLVSNAVLAKQNIFDNKISIPSKSEFIKRQVQRSNDTTKSKSELIKEAEEYYNDLITKWYDEYTIDDTFVSDIINTDILSKLNEDGEPDYLYVP